MRLIQRIAAVAAAVLFVVPAIADEKMEDNAAVSALIDLTAAAAISSGETMMPQTNGMLSEAFCNAVLWIGQGTLGITEKTGIEWFLKAYGAAPATMPVILPQLETDPSYTGVLVLSAGPSDSEGTGAVVSGTIYRAPERIDSLDDDELANLEWLGQSITVWLCPYEEAPGGWQLTTYVIGDHVVNDSAAGFMVDYVSNGLGIYGVYPAEFGEDVLVEASEGISGRLRDGSAEFAMIAVERGDTEAEDIIREMQAYGSQVEIDPATGAIRGYALLDNDMIRMEEWLIGAERLYHMEISFNIELTEKYKRMAEYMINAFGAYELGVS